MDKKVLMYSISAIILLFAFVLYKSNQPYSEVTSVLTITDTTTNMTKQWSTNCKEHEYSCNPTSIQNARTMYMGDDITYTCTAFNKLYISRKESTLSLVPNSTCIYTVTTQEVKK